MGKLSRLIGGVVAGKLTGWRHSRSPSHVARCADCSAALRRERQYLERLRAATVPQASSDLTARLLERTYRLAQDPGSWQASAASAAAPGQGRGLVAFGAAAGGAALAAAVLAVAAYAVAGDPLPAARGAGQGAAPMTFADIAPTGSATTGASADGRDGSATNNADLGPLSRTGHAPSESDPGESDTGENDPGNSAAGSTHPGTTVELSQRQLDVLRAQGWTCPELRGLGFHLEGAHATVGDAGASVELKLSDGTYNVTVVERRSAPSSVQLGAGQLSVTSGSPWQATYSTPLATLSMASDLPAPLSDEAMAELVRAGTATDAAGPEAGSESVLNRVQRGLRTIAGLAGF